MKKNYAYHSLKPDASDEELSHENNQISMNYDSGQDEEECVDVSITEYQREYYKNKPPGITRATLTFKRALIKFRGFRLWHKMLVDMRLFGTGCTLFDAQDKYKENIKDVVEKKLLKSESKDNEDNNDNRWLFKYDSHFVFIWDSFLLCFILYSIFAVPFLVAFKDFDPAGPYYKFEIFVDLFFAMDIVVSLNSEYKTEAGKILNSKREIYKHYVQDNYKKDIVILFPFFLLIKDQNSGLRIVKMLRVLKISKFFSTFSKLFEHSTVLNSYQAVTRLITGMVTVIIMTHLVACLWFIAARTYNFAPETWVYRNNLLDISDSDFYLSGFYWACTVLTTVGYGDITPFTTFEVLVAISWMICGIGFYSLVVGSLSSVLSSLDEKSEVIQSKLDMLDLFIKNTQLEDSKAIELRKTFHDQLQKLSLDYNEKIALVSSLSKNLRYEVCMKMYDNAADKIDFFVEKKDRNKSFIYDIIPRLSHAFYEKTKTIYKKGRFADEMYFLVNGRVSYVYLYQSAKLSFKDIIKGSYFGEVEIIEQIPREFTAVALISSEMLIMKKDDFNYMLTQYPIIAKDIRFLAKERRKRNNKAKGEIIDILEIVKIRKLSSYEELAGTPYKPKPQPPPVFRGETGKNVEEEEFLNEICKHVNDKFDLLEQRLDSLNISLSSQNLNPGTPEKSQRRSPNLLKRIN